MHAERKGPCLQDGDDKDHGANAEVDSEVGVYVFEHAEASQFTQVDELWLSSTGRQEKQVQVLSSARADDSLPHRHVRRDHLSGTCAAHVHDLWHSGTPLFLLTCATSQLQISIHQIIQITVLYYLACQAKYCQESGYYVKWQDVMFCDCLAAEAVSICYECLHEQTLHFHQIEPNPILMLAVLDGARAVHAGRPIISEQQ